jgi:hypothetical protein
MTDLPAPMTPPECDLRGMPFMPVDLVRLFDSDLYALSTGDEFKAAFTLWGKAFLQVPAGSLPTDDRILAHLSGTGVGWKKVKDMALRGWIKASDGRLYHPVVAEKAREAWEARVAQRARTEAARIAKAAKRAGGVSSSDNALSGYVASSATASVAPSVTEDATGSKGQGQGQGQGIIEEPPNPHAAGAAQGDQAAFSHRGKKQGLRSEGTNPRAIAAAEAAAAPPPPEPDHELWPYFRGRITPGEFRAWLGKASLRRRDDGSAAVLAPSRFLADHIRAAHGADLANALGCRVDVLAQEAAA